MDGSAWSVDWCWRQFVSHENQKAFNLSGTFPTILQRHRQPDFWILPGTIQLIHEVNAIRENERVLAFHESILLKSTNDGQYGSEESNNARPPQHAQIKSVFGPCVVALALSGALIGIWSVVFWDWLGRWRWIVSAAGWAFMVASMLMLFHKDAALTALDRRSENVIATFLQDISGPR
jgi:hypothetical protein